MSGRHAYADTTLAVVHEPDGGAAPGAPLVFALCGPLGTPQAEAVAARLAQRHRAWSVSLDSEGSTGRHLLRLTPAVTAHPAPEPPVTAELLADLLAPPTADTVPVTGHQRDILLAAVTRQGGPGRHTEQLFWNWSGPLDTGTFTAAWQSVADREAVLRVSFDWSAAPRLVLHERAAVEVVRHEPSTVSWSDLLRRDRMRGFVLHRPGLLRVALLDGPSPPARADREATRVLLSYHRALLDERSAHLLVREFYRAYLAGGVVPGGERRPDVRDHAAWLAGHGTEAARQFWARAAPPRDAAVSPGRPAGPTHQVGPGRIQRRLRPHQTARLRSWAALQGAGESSALHVVWALLLYRAAGVRGPAPVSFGVHFSGRDLSLRDAAAAPGLLGSALPMTVIVEPAAPVEELLRQVRDAALDLTSYAWVPGDRVREWSGRDDGKRLTDTLVRFDSRPEFPQALLSELAAQDIEVDHPHSASGDTSLPVTLVAQHEASDVLLLTAAYDRAEMSDADASRTLSQCMQLLRRLSDRQSEGSTVEQVLALLENSEVPRAARHVRTVRSTTLAVLRPGEPWADVICLITVPGVPPGAYEALVREYEGPERIVSLGRLGDPQGPPPSAPRELLREARRLVLCGCGPAGPVAYEIGRGLTARAAAATTVIMTGIGDAEESARALARALRRVRADSG
ncbi:condensation domain-containing protein [Streptomyces sp. NBC_01465]|uniref:condensation domain-containing protein n=1 Tax=Streptomyces sp. NBC_01465 TaxID=2903878 RepID=UPI002E2FD125|nr:condensation domain-containing protein [Streptomyces sp. NBC_01465]